MNKETRLKAIAHNRAIIGNLLALDDHTPEQDMQLVSAVAALQALEAEPFGFIPPDAMSTYRGQRTGGNYSPIERGAPYFNTVPIFLQPPSPDLVSLFELEVSSEEQALQMLFNLERMQVKVAARITESAFDVRRTCESCNADCTLSSLAMKGGACWRCGSHVPKNEADQND